MKFVTNALVISLAKSSSAQLDGLLGSANASVAGGLANATQDIAEGLESTLGGLLDSVNTTGGDVEGGGLTDDFWGTMPSPDMVVCSETSCPAELCPRDEANYTPDVQIVSAIKDCFMYIEWICTGFCSGDFETTPGICHRCLFAECCDGNNTFADTCKVHYDAMEAAAAAASEWIAANAASVQLVSSTASIVALGLVLTGL